MIHYEVEDAIARITLESPPVNALTIPMLDALLDALRRAKDDSNVRAVILQSAISRCFCAGLDLAALQGASADHVRALLDKLYVSLTDLQHDLGKPSIAAISGAARGGGMTLAISCNVIVADDSASFGYPEIDVGLLPAIHFAHLPRIVGRHRAYELLFTGRAFGAEEARALGLISRIAADARAETLALARTFAAKSPTAMALGHAEFMRANDYRAELAPVIDAFVEASISEDGREGVKAFAEKRKPTWQPTSQEAQRTKQ
jgi:enoyl-CoA hydratase/carnithine racemase